MKIWQCLGSLVFGHPAGASWALPLQFLKQMRAGDVQPDMILGRGQWNGFVIGVSPGFQTSLGPFGNLTVFN
jgi:hypothetical protein